MSATKKNILITGQPGVGKTTLIRQLAERFRVRCPVGFYTSEIREKGIRKGFELVSLSGEKGLLSHVNIDSRYRVSKYGVDVAGFDAFLDSISFFGEEGTIIIIDEIGKMECFSRKFENLVRKILDSPKAFIATIALRGGGIISEVKRRDDVELIEASTDNSDRLLDEIVERVASPRKNRI